MVGELGRLLSLQKEHAACKQQYLKGRENLSTFVSPYHASETDGAAP